MLFSLDLPGLVVFDDNPKRLKGMSDGMDTEVGIQMINKCKIQMIRKDLYNVEEPHEVGAEKE